MIQRSALLLLFLVRTYITNASRTKVRVSGCLSCEAPLRVFMVCVAMCVCCLCVCLRHLYWNRILAMWYEVGSSTNNRNPLHDASVVCVLYYVGYVILCVATCFAIRYGFFWVHYMCALSVWVCMCGASWSIKVYFSLNIYRKLEVPYWSFCRVPVRKPKVST
jgi:hypothetical protein